MEKNLYEILNISKHASTEEIERTYKILSIKYTQKFKEDTDKAKLEKSLSVIKNAYEILSDDKKRIEYDKFLKEKEENKKIIEENIRSINDSDFEETLNDSFKMTDEAIELPELEEVSKEEEQMAEEAKKKENKKASKKKIYKIIICVLIITMIGFAIFMCLFANKSKQKNDTNTQKVAETKTLKSGERLPSEILLNKNIKNDFYETHIEMDLIYCEEYDVYYKYLPDTKVEIYYNKNIPFSEGRMWLYSGVEGITYFYEEYYDEFIYDSFLEGTSYYYSFEEKHGINVDDDYETVYLENGYGEVFYYDDMGVVVYLKEGEYNCFIDINGRECFVANDKTRYYVDENNDLRYYRDDQGKYYFEEDGYRYYEDESVEFFEYYLYRDKEGKLFYRDEYGKKIYNLEDLY